MTQPINKCDGKAMQILHDYKERAERAEAECAKLRDRLNDWQDTHTAIMKEQCAGDEKHCTCVPSLRKGLKELQAECAKLREEIKEIHSVTVPRETYEDETRDKMRWKEECAKMWGDITHHMTMVEHEHRMRTEEMKRAERAEARLEALTSDAASRSALQAWFDTGTMKEALAAARAEVIK